MRALLAAAGAGRDTEAHTALLSEICATLQPYMDDTALGVPYETHVAVAST